MIHMVLITAEFLDAAIEKLARVGFEHKTTKFCLDAKVDWAIGTDTYIYVYVHIYNICII